jgi:hypothetical protein
MNKEKTQKNNLADLPDKTLLKKLAAALWQEDNSYHGAAVMVGAGFSRSAAVTGESNKKLPLWHDLSKVLNDELGAGNNSDPLRQAEEYCAFFGKQALHDLVKKEINDSAWTAGELHKSLLELPWSEVLTTNWDTLLERASKEIHHPVYSVVSRQEDLASARAPRIVKLHGTVNVTENLIFTQEDYRQYPQRHAAFVNFARQVFIENELCLLGFSGDDPNFLQWTGWVRDHLAMHARRIYLVGALHLTAAKRKYLESINIAPIDLSDLVADYDDHDAKHLAATKIFLQTLQELKPSQAWEWSPTQLDQSTLTTEELEKKTQNSGYAATLLEQQLPILKNDRESFPGWLVCPNRQRWELQNQINDPFPTPQNLSEMASNSREKLLYEIAWRHGVTYEAITPWLAQELLKICDPAKLCILTKRQQMEVALLLLKNTRWFNDPESLLIEKITTEILEKNSKYWPESTDELAFHQAIAARDKFDYPALERLTDKISERDPLWKLKKASLLVELGRFEQGEILIAEAYRELLIQYRNDRNSIYIFSRLAWAHWLFRSTEFLKPGLSIKAFPSNYQESKCSPWDHIEHLQNQISKALEKQQKKQGIEPSFEPGHYRDNSNTLIFNNELHPLLLLEGVTCSSGMPLRGNGIAFLVEQASRLAELDEIDGIHRFALAIRAASSDTSDALKKVFSRTRVACFPEEDVNYLFEHCIQAINYWNSKWVEGHGDVRSYAIDRLRVFIEVLARVSVRTNPEQSKQVFHLACKLGGKSEFTHLWLANPLKHLIDYSLKSIPESEHHELLPDALSFPLQREIDFKDHSEWPNPIINLPGSRGKNATLDRRIDEIIDSIAPCTPESAPALLRLLPLLKNRFLTDSEQKKIMEKVWGLVPDYQKLPETGLLKYILLTLPAQDPSAVRILVRNYLFQAEGDNIFNQTRLVDIANVACVEKTKELPTEDQATNYFDRLVAWRAKQNHKDPFGLSDKKEKKTGELIGMALARSIVPALPETALNEENFQKLYSFYSEVESSEVIIAFPIFSAASSLFDDRVERFIRQGLQEQGSQKTACSSYALLKWREQVTSVAASRLISRLVYTIGSSRKAGLAALLWTASQLCKKGYLSEVETDSLIEILPVIFDNSDYKNISHSSREAVTVSLVRAACVRLARDILIKSKYKNSELIRVLENAKHDALPEVRFAEIMDN